MAKAENFQADWISSPGDTILDILEEQQLSMEEFALSLGFSAETTRFLLSGRCSITLGIARRLSKLLGGSVEFWMSRDAFYRMSAVDDTAHRKWLQRLPVSDMIKFGWISDHLHPAEEVAECFRFFGVDSLESWNRRYQPLLNHVAFRKSKSFESEPAAVAAWLRQAELQAEIIQCRPFDPKLLHAQLMSVRALTRISKPEKFLPELKRQCSICGVAVAVVRTPPGCRASGATLLLKPERALLVLSFRHLTDDHFWFSFFHEAAHLCLHADRSPFIETDELETDMREQEANDLASEILIPERFWPRLHRLPPRIREVLAFAREVGTSPGIVVGQMQHKELIGFNQLNKLKRRFRWCDSGTISRGMP